MKRTKTALLVLFIALDLFVLLFLGYVYLSGGDFNSIGYYLRGCGQDVNPPYCDWFQADHSSVSTPTPVVSEGFFTNAEIVSVSPPVVEDYLPNPGIGWQWDSDDESSQRLPEAVAYARRSRVSWNLLNPEQGVYDWSALDEQLSDATARGKQFSFRVYSMSGEEFGGHEVPQWVLDNGGRLLSTGEPDYSSCVYQQAWGDFVNALGARYDGDPDIAFIDISGYGNFNEWSWQDSQTQWDYAWEEAYNEGYADETAFETLDGQARRRLADAFLGGSFEGHACKDADGNTVRVDYAYPGFQSTQLVMPLAGIVQSTQYVYLKRPDVGLRYDCLGRQSDSLDEKLDDILPELWRTAPVVFEFCGPDQVNADQARRDVQLWHASLVHNNETLLGEEALRSLLRDVGYRYLVRRARFQMVDGASLRLSLEWQNVGLAPSYPKMGQDFEVHFYLLGASERESVDYVLPADVSAWMPAGSPSASAPGYLVNAALRLPESLPPGTYEARVAILDLRTGKPICLPFSEADRSGRYFLTMLEIPGP